MEIPKKVPFYGERNASCFQIGVSHHLHRLQRVRRLRRRLNRLHRVSRLRRRVSLLRPLRLRAKSGSVYLPPTKVLIVMVRLH